MPRSKTILFVISLFISLFSYSQDYDKEKSDKYFYQGLIAFDNADYISADSLFTKAYELMPDEKALFNLAITKLRLDSTCIGCALLNYGSRKNFVAKFENMLDQKCIVNRDSSYYNKKFQPLPNPNNYKYLAVETQYICDSVISGIIYTNGYSSTTWSNNKIQKTNVFATYIIHDQTKYYQNISGSKFRFNNEVRIEDFKKRFEKYLNSKYDFSSIPNSEAWCSVSILVNTEGSIDDAILTHFPSKYFDEASEKVIKSEIRKSFKNLRGLKPERFKRSDVNKIASVIIGMNL